MQVTNHDLLILRSTRPTALKRKAFLEPLADRLGLDHTKYKNRETLAEALLSACPAHDQFANAYDPVLLCPIQDIPSERLVTWEQDNSKYAADVQTMHSLLRQGCTINPWAIDKASGNLCASNREEYLQRFDMMNVPGLVEKVQFLHESLRLPKLATVDTTAPIHVRQRDDIEQCSSDLYITHIIDYFEYECSPAYAVKLLLTALVSVIEQFFQHMHIPNSTDDESESVQMLSNMDQLSFGLKTRQVNSNNTALGIASEFFSTCNEVLSDTIVSHIFEALDKLVKDNHHTTDNGRAAGDDHDDGPTT